MEKYRIIYSKSYYNTQIRWYDVPQNRTKIINLTAATVSAVPGYQTHKSWKSTTKCFSPASTRKISYKIVRQKKYRGYNSDNVKQVPADWLKKN